MTKYIITAITVIILALIVLYFLINRQGDLATISPDKGTVNYISGHRVLYPEIENFKKVYEGISRDDFIETMQKNNIAAFCEKKAMVMNDIFSQYRKTER
jgi:hypothetical protein